MTLQAWPATSPPGDPRKGGAPPDVFPAAAAALVSRSARMGAVKRLEDVSVLVVGRRSSRLRSLVTWLADEGCAVQGDVRLDQLKSPATLDRRDVIILDVGTDAVWLVAGRRAWTDLPIIVIDVGRGAT